MWSVKKIELIFENCEVAVIDGKHVGYLLADDISEYYSVRGCNAFGHTRTCHTFRLEIHRDADGKLAYGFDDTSLFERISRYDDITSVEIYTDDGKIDLYVDWEGDDYHNDNQSSCIADSGHLYLVISEKESVEDFFEEVLEDKEYKWPWFRREWGESDAKREMHGDA